MTNTREGKEVISMSECPDGYEYVQGHMRDGVYVHGYCRPASTRAQPEYEQEEIDAVEME